MSWFAIVLSKLYISHLVTLFTRNLSINHRWGGGGHAFENFDVHLCNLIGQLLNFNALRVLCISIYGVQVLRGLSY